METGIMDGPEISALDGENLHVKKVSDDPGLNVFLIQ